MPKILSDTEIRRILGTVIVNGDAACIRPNAYVLRLGAKGEFINTRKEFDIGSDKKGLRIQPGHAVGVTAFETLDFRRETVHKFYPGHDLHAIVSPTTDLSREGILAQTTQVDAAFTEPSIGRSQTRQVMSDGSCIKSGFTESPSFDLKKGKHPNTFTQATTKSKRDTFDLGGPGLPWV